MHCMAWANPLDFDRVHLYAVVRDYHAQVFDLRNLKLALLWFAEQIVLF